MPLPQPPEAHLLPTSLCSLLLSSKFKSNRTPNANPLLSGLVWPFLPCTAPLSLKPTIWRWQSLPVLLAQCQPPLQLPVGIGEKEALALWVTWRGVSHRAETSSVAELPVGLTLSCHAHTLQGVLPHKGLPRKEAPQFWSSLALGKLSPNRMSQKRQASVVVGFLSVFQ